MKRISLLTTLVLFCVLSSNAQAPNAIPYGCMAKDFYAAFKLDGESDMTINTLDIDGINMAAIQALKIKNG